MKKEGFRRESPQQSDHPNGIRGIKPWLWYQNTRKYSMRNLRFFIVSKEGCICPECKSLLEHREIVPRIQRYPDKEPQWFKIERRQCTNESCGNLRFDEIVAQAIQRGHV